MAFSRKKTQKLWIIKAVARSSRRIVAWVTGSRDVATFQRLYNKVKQLKNCTFYTDGWDVFAKVLPKERHIIGKAGTVTIERDNSNTRHHLGRMTRRTKVVSKKEQRVNDAIKLWSNLTDKNIFKYFQTIFLSIFQ